MKDAMDWLRELEKVHDSGKWQCDVGFDRLELDLLRAVQRDAAEWGFLRVAELGGCDGRCEDADCAARVLRAEMA